MKATANTATIKVEYRGEHRGGYYGDGRTECPNSNCPW